MVSVSGVNFGLVLLERFEGCLGEFLELTIGPLLGGISHLHVFLQTIEDIAIRVLKLDELVRYDSHLLD